MRTIVTYCETIEKETQIHILAKAEAAQAEAEKAAEEVAEALAASSDEPPEAA